MALEWSEWTPYNGSVWELKNELATNPTYEAGLLPVGVQIEDDHGTRWLVGDINQEAGHCQCCHYDYSTVVRYRRLLGLEEDTNATAAG